MVTQATSTEPQEVSPEEDGDQPLIPVDDTSEMLVAPAVVRPAGADEDSQGDAESDQPEGAASPEQEQTTEDVKEEETPETEEPEEPAPRSYSEEEWNRRQSALDRRIAAIEEQNRTLQNQLSQSALDAQVRAYENILVQDFVKRGYSEDDAQDFARDRAQLAKSGFLADRRAQELERELQTERQEKEQTARSAVVRDVVRKYNIQDEDMDTLLAIDDPNKVESVARRLASLYTTRREVAAQRKAEVPPNGAEQQFDSGEGQSGMTDTQWLNERFNTGLDNDVARAQRILAKRGTL